MVDYSELNHDELRALVKEAYGEAFQNESDEIRKELVSESPRACVLVGAAWIEKYLHELIEVALPRDKIFRKVFLSPLRSIGHRIQVAHALGIIRDDEKSTFEIVKKIRNKFAHRTIVSFDDEDVSEIIEKLVPFARIESASTLEKDAAQSVFSSVISVAAADLFSRSRLAKKYDSLDDRLDLLRYMSSKITEQ